MDEKHVERLRALLADMDQFESARTTSTILGGYRSRLRTILQDAVKPARWSASDDVVTQAEVNDLPEGSIVVAAREDGTPKVGHTVTVIGRGGGRLTLNQHYRVLYRAPEKPVEVGDVITGKRANGLPDGSIIRHARGDSSSSSSYPLTKRNGEWRTSAMGPAHEPHRSSSQFRVLDLGGN